MPVFVDYGRQMGRPSEYMDNSAHLWADDFGAPYTFVPLGEQVKASGTEDDLALDLSPRRWERFLQKQRKRGDFSRALGRRGVDHRLPDEDHSDDQEVLLYYNDEYVPNYDGRFSFRRFPIRDGQSQRPRARARSTSPRSGLRVRGEAGWGLTSECTACAARLKVEGGISANLTPWRRSMPSRMQQQQQQQQEHEQEQQLPDQFGGTDAAIDDDDFATDGLVT